MRIEAKICTDKNFPLHGTCFYSEEMRPKDKVATREAGVHYADLTPLLISVSWMMLLDKRSSFVLVVRASLTVVCTIRTTYEVCDKK